MDTVNLYNPRMNQTKTSKFLSLILRHDPGAAGIELDGNGWVDVETLLEAVNANGHSLSRFQLEQLVADNDKQRFVISANRIRANQGHSIEVDLDLKPTSPPNVLFHGTATRFVQPIINSGLRKMSRQHVHLSEDLETARKVGVRHGKLAIFEIDAGLMHSHGHDFYLSQNGVWLVDRVPTEYLRRLPRDA